MHDVLQTANAELVIGRFAQVTMITAFEAWSPEVWDTHCENTVRLMKQHGVSRAVFYYSVGPSPTSAQRRKIADMLHPFIESSDHDVLCAVMSDSLLIRGAATAFSWLLPGRLKLRAFAPAQLRAAAEWMAPAVGSPADDIVAAFRQQLQIGLQSRPKLQIKM